MAYVGDYGNNPNDPANSYPGGSSNAATPWWQTPGPWGTTPDANGNYYTPPSGGTYGTAPGSINFPGNYAPGQNGSVNNAPGAPDPTGAYQSGWGLPSTTTTDNTPPTPTAGPSGTGGVTGSLGSMIAPFTGTFTAPTNTALPTVPGFTPPSYTPPPAFSYQDFKGPDAQSVLADSGYQFRLGQGEQALQQNAAATGTLNTGGTLKDILNYGQNYASNEFQNVWNRDLVAYQTNYGKALQAYNTNYNTQYLDPYNIAYQGASQGNQNAMTGYSTNAAATQHANDMNYSNAWNQFLNNQNTFYGRQDANWNKVYQTATAT